MTNNKYAYSIFLGSEKVELRLSKHFSSQLDTWSTPRHSNAEYELHIILNGKVDMEMEEQIYPISARQALIIAPGLYHYPTITEKPFKRFSISFTLSDVPLLSAIQACVPNYMIFNIPVQLVSICNSIYCEYDADDPYHNEMIHALLTNLIITIFRTLKLTEHNFSARHMIEEEARIPIIDSYFSTFYFDEIGGEDALAKSLHLSKRQLARVLKQHYGMSFQQKLFSSRMDRAAWLLRTSDKSCEEISLLVGYSSESAFYKAFRKFFHITPNKYRKHYRQ